MQLYWAAIGATVGEVLAQLLSVNEPGSRPVADRAAALAPTSVTSERDPLRTPAAVGVKRRVIGQLAPPASEEPQVVETKLKSPPVTVVASGTVTHIGRLPELVSVAVASADWPTAVVAQLVNVRLTVGAVPWVAIAFVAVPALVAILGRS